MKAFVGETQRERELWLCYERCFTYLCPSEIINYKFYVAHSLELKPEPEVAALDDVADDDIKQTSSNGWGKILRHFDYHINVQK